VLLVVFVVFVMARLAIRLRLKALDACSNLVGEGLSGHNYQALHIVFGGLNVPKSAPGEIFGIQGGGFSSKMSFFVSRESDFASPACKPGHQNKRLSGFGAPAPLLQAIFNGPATVLVNPAPRSPFLLTSFPASFWIFLLPKPPIALPIRTKWTLVGAGVMF
jgi:hypothetical protein